MDECGGGSSSSDFHFLVTCICFSTQADEEPNLINYRRTLFFNSLSVVMAFSSINRHGKCDLCHDHPRGPTVVDERDKTMRPPSAAHKNTNYSGVQTKHATKCHVISQYQKKTIIDIHTLAGFPLALVVIALRYHYPRLELL